MAVIRHSISMVSRPVRVGELSGMHSSVTGAWPWDLGREKADSAQTAAMAADCFSVVGEIAHSFLIKEIRVIHTAQATIILPE